MRILRLSAWMSVLLLASSCSGGEDTGGDPTTEPAEGPSEEAEEPSEADGGAEEPDAGDSELEDADPEDYDPEPVSRASMDPNSVHVLVNKQNPLDPLDYSLMI